MRRAAVPLLLAATGCGADPVTASNVARYTGLSLCPAAEVRDLTTTEERDTTPGFMFHVLLRVPASCRRDFEAQVARLGGPECAGWARSAQGCFVEDASRLGPSKRHSSVAVSAFGHGRYDLRFYS